MLEKRDSDGERDRALRAVSLHRCDRPETLGSPAAVNELWNIITYIGF